jgi:calpain-15
MSNPNPNDIQQGHLGDCWFMAALTLVTERRDILSHILVTSEVNEEGAYLVRICHNGLWKIVLIDDCFPCTQDKQLVFAKVR